MALGQVGTSLGSEVLPAIPTAGPKRVLELAVVAEASSLIGMRELGLVRLLLPVDWPSVVGVGSLILVLWTHDAAGSRHLNGRSR